LKSFFCTGYRLNSLTRRLTRRLVTDFPAPVDTHEHAQTHRGGAKLSLSRFHRRLFSDEFECTHLRALTKTAIDFTGASRSFSRSATSSRRRRNSSSGVSPLSDGYRSRLTLDLSSLLISLSMAILGLLGTTVVAGSVVASLRRQLDAQRVAQRNTSLSPQIQSRPKRQSDR